MCCLLSAVFWKIEGLVFFNLKLILDPKLLKNTVNTLINLSMTTKNKKKYLKNQNQSEAKMILMIRSTSSGKKRRKKNIYVKLPL
jgi:hypothetical protein